jgi:hypothetical protein
MSGTGQDHYDCVTASGNHVALNPELFEMVENHGISDDINQIVKNHSATVKKSEINFRYFRENVQ